MQGLNWKRIKKQPTSKDKLWKAFKKAGELLLQTTFKKYKKVWLIRSKMRGGSIHLHSAVDYYFALTHILTIDWILKKY